MDELQMNKIRELAEKFAIKSLWTMWFDALSELNDLDIAILYTLYGIKNPANGTNEWTTRDLEKKMAKSFNDIHESLYGKLRPKGLIIAEKRNGQGNKIFLSLTETGEKFIYEASTTSKTYLDYIKKKFEKPEQKKEKIKLL